MDRLPVGAPSPLSPARPRALVRALVAYCHRRGLALDAYRDGYDEARGDTYAARVEGMLAAVDVRGWSVSMVRQDNFNWLVAARTLAADGRGGRTVEEVDAPSPLWAAGVGDGLGRLRDLADFAADLGRRSGESLIA